MRPVVDGVGPGEGTDAVRELDDPPDVGGGADGVGGDRERDDARPVVQLGGEAVVVERKVVEDLDLADDDAEVVLQGEPGCDVAVVVELRHEHLVAAPSSSRASARVSRKLSDVMLCPKATSSPEQPRNAPAFS